MGGNALYLIIDYTAWKREGLRCTSFKIRPILWVESPHSAIRSCVSLSFRPNCVLQSQLGNDTYREVLRFATTLSWTTEVLLRQNERRREVTLMEVASDRVSNIANLRGGLSHSCGAAFYRGQKCLPCGSCLHTMHADANSLDAYDVLPKQILILHRDEQTPDAFHNDIEYTACTP